MAIALDLSVSRVDSGQPLIAGGATVLTGVVIGVLAATRGTAEPTVGSWGFGEGAMMTQERWGR